MCIGIIPVVLQHKPIFRQILNKRFKHGCGALFFPVSLQLTCQSKRRDRFCPCVRHTRHGRFNLIAIPAAARINDRKDLITIIEQGQGRERAACANRYASDNNVFSSGTGNDVIKRLTERGVFISINNPGTAIDRQIREKRFDFWQGVAIAHLKR